MLSPQTVTEEEALVAELELLGIRYLSAHPGYSDGVLEALTGLNETQGTVLRLFYTAAVLMQARCADKIKPAMDDEWRRLPDLFSAEIGVPSQGDALTGGLDALAQVHRARTDIAANWSGTYDNVARKLIHLTG